MKKTKQTRVQFANRHPNPAIEQRIEARAAELYPTGCQVLFGQEQAYVVPIDWNLGPGHVMAYSGLIWKTTIKDMQTLKTEKTDPDPFKWLLG
jgi:hypothetical protein